MKKGFKLVIYIILTVFCFWLFLTDQIAKNTEQQLKEFLAQQQKSTTSLLRLQLVDYKRKLFQANVTIAIHSDHEDIEQILGGSVLQSRIEHGPVIFDQASKGLVFAYSRTTVQFDLERLNEQVAFIISRLFNEQNPVIAQIKADFHSMLHYEVGVAPINYELFGASISLSKGVMQGQYISFSNRHLVTYNMGNVMLKNDKTEWFAENKQLRFLLHQDRKVDITNAYDADMSVPISIPMKRLYQPILEKFSQTIRTYISAYPDPVHENSQLSSDITTGQFAFLIHILRLYEELKNLDNQLSWVLEEATETQEGQEHFYFLLHQFEQKAMIVTSLVNERLLRSQVSEEVFPLNTPTLF